jgi:hypothetical protein
MKIIRKNRLKMAPSMDVRVSAHGKFPKNGNGNGTDVGTGTADGAQFGIWIGCSWRVGVAVEVGFYPILIAIKQDKDFVDRKAGNRSASAIKAAPAFKPFSDLIDCVGVVFH